MTLQEILRECKLRPGKEFEIRRESWSAEQFVEVPYRYNENLQYFLTYSYERSYIPSIGDLLATDWEFHRNKKEKCGTCKGLDALAGTDNTPLVQSFISLLKQACTCDKKSE